MAKSVDMMPSCSPFWSITLTGEIRILSFVLVLDFDFDSRAMGFSPDG